METMRRFSRRTFVAWVGGASAGFYLFGRLPGTSAPVALAQIPGRHARSGRGAEVPTPMLIPPVMPRAGTISQRGGKPVDYYEISMRQFAQQILPAGLPATTVWGYGAKVGAEQARPAHPQRPVADDRGQVEPAGPGQVDQRARGRKRELPASPAAGRPDAALGEPARRAGRPRHPADVHGDAGPYTGPVPIVTHVHGAVGVADDSDGYAEAWYLPSREQHPGGLRHGGHVVRLLRRQGRRDLRRHLGTRLRHLPVPEREPGLDDLVPRPRARHDAPQRLRGPGRLLPRPRRAGRRRCRARHAEPASRRRYPARRRGRTTSSRPTSRTGRSRSRSRIARSTRTARSSTRTPGSSSTGSWRDYIPDGEFSPIWNPEFFGNMIMVNGNTWPFLTVERRRYRFRFLNGCQSRFLILDFSEIPGVEVWQIGNEGGFLAAPVNLTADHGNRLLMGLAERADVIVDFTNVPVGSYVLGNVGPDEPFGGGVPGRLRRRRPRHHRPDHAVPRRARGRRRRLDPAAVPPAARDHAAAGGDDHAAAGADREGGRGLRRGRAKRSRARSRRSSARWLTGCGRSESGWSR